MLAWIASAINISWAWIIGLLFLSELIFKSRIGSITAGVSNGISSLIPAKVFNEFKYQIDDRSDYDIKLDDNKFEINRIRKEELRKEREIYLAKQRAENYIANSEKYDLERAKRALARALTRIDLYLS